MKKILYVTNLPAPYKIAYFNILSRQAELTVIYERMTANNRDIKWKSEEKIHSFKEIHLKGCPVGEEASFAPEIIKYLKKDKYDIVLMNGYSSPTAILAIAYMRLTKIEFGLVCDGMLPTVDTLLKKKIKKFLISSASFWLSSGKITSELLEKYGADSEEIYRYPFSSLQESQIIKTPISIQKKKGIKEKLGIAENKVVLTVGQFIYRKGYDILIKAAQHISSDVGIYIVGGIPTEEYLRMKEQYGVQNVHFVGFKTTEELSQYYKAANLFVLPTREDIWGLVINEAMAYGLPIITTLKCGAGLELVEEDVNGCLIDVDDLGQLYEAINRIIDNDEQLERMSWASIKTIQNHTIEKTAVKHMQIFEGRS